MKHHHPHIFAITAGVLLIGLSISGGPVVWAMLVMVAPLVAIMYFTARGTVHHGAPHPSNFRQPPPR